MTDDPTKKVIIPEDKSGDGKLMNEFTDYRADYGALPGNRASGQDDIPFQPQPTVNNVTPVSLRSARQRAGQDSLLNKNQVGASDTLTSDKQYLSDVDKPATIDRTSQTFTLGQFIKKGAAGRRAPLSDEQIGDIVRRPGDVLLREVDPVDQGPFESPHGRSLKGNSPALGDSETVPGSGPLVQRTVSAVLSQNRFSSISEATVYAATGDNPDEATFTSLQDYVGANGVGQGDTPLKLEDLKGVAMDVINVAMGIKPGSNTNEDVEYGQAKVIATDIRARNAAQIPGQSVPGITSLKASSGQFSEPGLGEVTSYGQLNSPDQVFDGLAPIEMIALAFGVLTATAGYLSLSSFIIGIGGAVLGSKSAPGTRPYSLGSFQKTNQFTRVLSAAISREDFGLIYTKAPLAQALQQGILSLFGLGGANFTSAGAAAQAALDVAKAAANITRSPGFYVVFGRAVLRDVEDLINRVSGVTEAPPGIQGALTFIEALKTSKVVGGINALAAVGDSIITGDASPFDLDNLKEAPHKSRKGTGSGESATDLRLAWRNSGTTSLLRLSPPTVFAQQALGGREGKTLGLGSMASMENAHLRSSKISSAEAAQIENLLDSEYVPFYFKDLRTNEIVSFHAFISNLTDDFNANYNQVRAIGRADPVQIYGSTKRSISFDFFVAATSKEDFDQMWYKVNKLVSLLYPQYTRGRRVEGAASSNTGLREGFTMPFSQVQSASPMIRLRIGDVIRSNYSKLNLSRLFGLGTESFIPDAKKLDKLSESEFQEFFNKLSDFSQKTANEVSDIIDKVKNPAQGAFGVSTSGGLSAGDVVRVSYPSTQYLDINDTGLASVGKGLAGGIGGLILPPDRFYLPFKDVFAKVVSRKGTADGVRAALGGGGSAAPTYSVSLHASLQDALNGKGKKLKRAEKSNYILSHNDAVIIPQGIGRVKNRLNKLREDLMKNTFGQASLMEYEKSSASFFDARNNAVVRSFEESGGKGLAGFISRMSFNWINNSTVWETSFGSRAPKICEIRMSFDPIHDIAPGLDSDGFNRAPVYQVGDVVQNVAGVEPTSNTMNIADAQGRKPISPGSDLVVDRNDTRLIDESIQAKTRK